MCNALSCLRNTRRHFGMVKTNWRCGNRRSRSSLRYSPGSSVRFRLQEGHKKKPFMTALLRSQGFGGKGLSVRRVHTLRTGIKQPFPAAVILGKITHPHNPLAGPGKPKKIGRRVPAKTVTIV